MPPNRVPISGRAATIKVALLLRRNSAPLRDNDAVAFVLIEEIEAFHHPQIETAGDVLGDFLNDMAAVLQPPKFRARRYRKDGFFAFFAVISELHRRSIPARSQNASISSAAYPP